MLNFVLSRMFYKLPDPIFTEDEIIQFNRLIEETGEGSLIEWSLPYPKLKFLQYLAIEERFLFHGSNTVHIDEFTPREQTLFNNKVTHAVFASAQPLWSMFYAVLDRSKVVGAFRNGCLVSKKETFVYYSINQDTSNNNPWTSGMMYILPRSNFKRADLNRIYFDEWISTTPIKPLYKLEIDVNDFPMLNKVAIHQNKESLYKTLFSYKRRTKS